MSVKSLTSHLSGLLKRAFERVADWLTPIDPKDYAYDIQPATGNPLGLKPQKVIENPYPFMI